MERNVGVTCICLALSNFICSKLGKKTAYIELNVTNQIYALSKKKSGSFFSKSDIDFFPNTTVASLSKVLSLNYDYFILDMGVLNTCTAKEFSKCDKQFIVCSLCKWKEKQTQEKLENFFYHTKINQRHVTVLDNLNMKKSTYSNFLLCFCKTISIPFIKNPFQLEPSLFSVFSNLLN